jgi:hypothetical protein
MDKLFSDLLAFIVSVVSHWQALATGGVVTMIVGFIERLTKWRLTKWGYVAVFVVAFLLASFFGVWRDEHAALSETRKSITQLQQTLGQHQQSLTVTQQTLLQTQQELELERRKYAPYLKGTIDAVNAGESEDKPGETGITIVANIENAGAPSNVSEYKLSIDIPGRERIWPTLFYLTRGVRLRDVGSEEYRQYETPDALYIKTIQPIQTGGRVPGWIFWVTKDATPDEIMVAGTTFTLYFRDVTGKEYFITRQLTRNGGHIPGYVPGADYKIVAPKRTKRPRP